MRISSLLAAVAFALLALSLALSQVTTKGTPQEWPYYGGNPEGTRYSPLKQINRSNVGRLQVAWTYDVSAPGGRADLQTHPLVVHGFVYGNTAGGQVVALDGATGKLAWSWDSNAGGRRMRGFAYWAEGADQRIFAGFGRYVYALNAKSGEVISGFGKDGRIDLHQDLDRDPEKQSVNLTTPGAVYKDLLILGGVTSESLPASYG